MTWKEQLKKLEITKEWDAAIEFLQRVIEKNPNDLDAYLSMNYLLMNLLVEEDYDFNKYDYYARILNQYFKESYSKFSNNPEYLFYTGKVISIVAECFLDIKVEETQEMIQKAMQIEPDNILYKYGYYSSIWGYENQLKAYQCAIKILENDSIVKQIESKGSLGEYILELMTNWSKDIEDELAGIKPKSWLKDLL